MEKSRSEQKEQLQKGIDETEANVKSMPAEQQETLKDVIKMLKEQLQSVDDPNNPMYSKEIEAMQKQAYEAEVAEYKKRWSNGRKTIPRTRSRCSSGPCRSFLMPPRMLTSALQL